MSSKRVTFDERQNSVKKIVCWSFAYNQSRKIYWQFFVSDRMRFKDRIRNVSFRIEPILHSAHRDRIYKDRFANDC